VGSVAADGVRHKILDTDQLQQLLIDSLAQGSQGILNPAIDQLPTRSLAERPRDTSSSSVVSFIIPTAQFFKLPITAASDLPVHKILLWLGCPTVKNYRRYLYSF